jgi:hypothetical protein
MIDSNVKSWRSTIGPVFFLSILQVSFRSKRLAWVARSSTESKLMSSSQGFTNFISAYRVVELILPSILVRIKLSQCCFSLENNKALCMLHKGALTPIVRHVRKSLAYMVKCLKQLNFILRHVLADIHLAAIDTNVMPYSLH